MLLVLNDQDRIIDDIDQLRDEFDFYVFGVCEEIMVEKIVVLFFEEYEVYQWVMFLDEVVEVIDNDLDLILSEKCMEKCCLVKIVDWMLSLDEKVLVVDVSYKVVVVD